SPNPAGQSSSGACFLHPLGQAETSELWMNPRDMPSMQSTSYYNMAGQTPHAALTETKNHRSGGLGESNQYVMIKRKNFQEASNADDVFRGL
ncbi:hypothetical protein Tco_1151776, partial [Tanacetum coccineum]